MSVLDIISNLTGGMVNTALIFFLTLMFSLPLGLIVCFGRMSRMVPLRLLTTLYIDIMRGTPLMLQILVVFFGPYYIFNIRLTPDYRFYAVIIAFVINYAAYFAEIYRGGIQATPVGQYEAANVLGYSRAQTFVKIILPQMIRRVLPSVTNEVITLVKDTSLAFTVAYMEMFTQAKLIASSQASMTPFIVAGVYYFVFNFAVAKIMAQIERKLAYYD